MDVEALIDKNIELLSLDAEVYRYCDGDDTIYRIFANVAGDKYAIEIAIADADSDTLVHEEVDKIFEEHDVEKLS